MDEASRMRGESIRKALDYPIRQQLVSPLHVELQPDNYEVHFRTDLVCQMCIAEYPNNALLLVQKSASNVLLGWTLKMSRHWDYLPISFGKLEMIIEEPKKCICKPSRPTQKSLFKH
ncbi:hypothetical protein ES332_A06G194200v1 [Gossypium tomentosum]|uniref:Uncharacterized protein n=1 Tax=Gossypium tomentosum TaxID=34277 RepID=A0A5D2Q6H7_GOSTO|nr:hypothetical protein ES332_A06G194200v1 [Gossypium tomentosum]